MKTVEEIYRVLDGLAPFADAESWDNCGILAGNRKNGVRAALVALDVTGAVIDEAVRRGCGLIISHHPVIFSPMKTVCEDSLVYRLIREDIAVISAHTNLDVAGQGVNWTATAAAPTRRWAKAVSCPERARIPLLEPWGRWRERRR